jgi:hypothetical protein
LASEAWLYTNINAENGGALSWRIISLKISCYNATGDTTEGIKIKVILSEAKNLAVLYHGEASGPWRSDSNTCPMRANKAKTFCGILALLLLTGAQTFSAPPIKLRVTAELANIRLKPSISSVIIRQIPEGAVLEAVRQEGEWYLVKLEPDESGTTTGYVHESLVLPLDEPQKKEVIPKAVEPAAKKESEPPKKTEPAAQKPQPEEIAEERAESPLAISIFAGGNYAAGGDLNKGAQGLADLYGNALGTAGDTKVAPARLGFAFGGEVAFALSPRVRITAGVDYYSSSKYSSVFYAATASTDAFYTEPKIRAVPVKLSLMYYPANYFYVRIGVVYSFAKCGYAYRFEHDKFWQEWEGEASARGLGCWGAVGFERALGRNFAFIIEAAGQYAPIRGFAGSGNYLDSDTKVLVKEEGKLYAYDAKITSKTSFPLVFIRSKLPAEGGVDNARQAEVDFSGFSLRAGIKIKF